MFPPPHFTEPPRMLSLSSLTVYVLYEIIFIEITLLKRKKKGNRVFFVYFIDSVKKESR
jgi:hypothetical protein